MAMCYSKKNNNNFIFFPNIISIPQARSANPAGESWGGAPPPNSKMTIVCFPCCLCMIPVTDEIANNETFYNKIICNPEKYSENVKQIVYEIKNAVPDGKWLNDGILINYANDDVLSKEDVYCNNGVRYEIVANNKNTSYCREIFDNEYFLFHKRCFVAIERYIANNELQITHFIPFFSKRKYGVDWDIQRGLYAEAKRHSRIFRLLDPKFSMENKKFILQELQSFEHFSAPQARSASSAGGLWGRAPPPW
jgi:hypothetical protein